MKFLIVATLIACANAHGQPAPQPGNSGNVLFRIVEGSTGGGDLPLYPPLAPPPATQTQTLTLRRVNEGGATAPVPQPQPQPQGQIFQLRQVEQPTPVAPTPQIYTLRVVGGNTAPVAPPVPQTQTFTLRAVGGGSTGGSSYSAHGSTGGEGAQYFSQVFKLIERQY